MTRVLITGSPETAKTTLAAFAASDAATTLVEPGQAVQSTEPYTHYVQMPVSISLDRGHGSVERFSEFIQAGLLTRSRLIREALPHLSEDATVLLVTGNAPDADAEDGALPDDPGARRSLLHVLAGALRQERPTLHVEVLDRSMGSGQIATKTLTGKTASRAQTSSDPESYEDWRIQMAGLVGSDF